MNKALLGTIAVTLIVGVGAGYLLGQYQIPSNHTMNSSITSMVDDIEKETGEARDAAFLEGMIVHHQGAIEMARIVAKSTMRPELTQMASNIISVQTAEITTMQGWLKEWFGR